MIKCDYCQKFNEPGLRFCIHCGSRLREHTSSELKPPKPYAWKRTEENFEQPQTHPLTQPLTQPLTRPQTQPLASQMAFPHPGKPHYYCPRCRIHVDPIISSKVADAGWVVFVLLLLFCLPLFWIGLLIRETILVCPFCRLRLG
ncbi:MAG: hypothetical protein D6687_06080 [Acidobacteria bacterium]|nr:MAG: hypothetical protein D6687_06080 [Acidobacteriota bacterium]GIU82634.1 MAG: hypothetical protein KatS3mg006_1698 [Pyrinomonadaceae bacterium]